MLPRVKYDLPSTHAVVDAERMCSPECSRYKGTLDVFNKVVRQEGFLKLWRGTNASLALAVPSVGIYLPLYDIFRNYMEDFTSQNAPTMTSYIPLVAGSLARSVACLTCYPIELARTRMQAFKESQTGVKPPGVWKTLVGVVSPVNNANNCQTLQSYRSLWTGLGAQLTRDVPFSAICWSTLEPLRRRLLSRMEDESRASHVLGANFCAGFVAGSIAAAATCPLDVARTRRQIEKDSTRISIMNTKRTLIEIWRDGGIKGLFTGVGPRVARAGPSVGIVVSFYEDCVSDPRKGNRLRLGCGNPVTSRPGTASVGIRSRAFCRQAFKPPRSVVAGSRWEYKLVHNVYICMGLCISGFA
ncbi:Mitochondrial carrier protein MTM1 [Abeliophyllum distichum]|uniref:Mitochondrial carrier protein MTM1 n=1 Tax=Abeliophyllum distichum TaxID=126358 RepID=A0ABD1NST3_9LAMI